MSIKLVSLKDFSGGLNVAAEEATLPTNMSASMQNVDILDSKSITRRLGYAAVSGTLGGTVSHLYRTYFANGSKQWIAVAGTQLISASPTSHYVGGRSEAEAVVVAASSPGWAKYTDPACSAGANEGALLFSTSTTGRFAIPKCDYIGLWMQLVHTGDPMTLTASIKVDGGAWVGVTATHNQWVFRDFSSLTATTHTVYVRGHESHVPGGARTWGICVDYFGTSLTVTTATLDSGTGDSWAFSMLNNKVYYGTETKDIRSLNASNVTATVSASGTARGAFAETLKNRLYVAGQSTDRALVYYSSVGKPEVFDDLADSGYMHLADKDAGQPCMGLKRYRTKLYYFSPSSVYALDPTGDTTNWVNVNPGENVGCIAPKSLVKVPNGLVFLSAGGVRLYGVGGEFTEEPAFALLSENIGPLLSAYTDAQRAAAAGAYHNNRYWLAIGSEVYVYRFPESGLPGAWTRYRYSGITISCLATTRGDEAGIYAGTTDGRIVQLDTGMNDGGNNIVDYYVTPPIAPGGYETIKHFRPAVDIGVEADTTQSLTVTPYTDDVASAAQTITVSPNTAVQTVRTPLSARGRALKLKVSGSGAAQPRTLTSIGVRYLPPRIR